MKKHVIKLKFSFTQLTGIQALISPALKSLLFLLFQTTSLYMCAHHLSLEGRPYFQRF